MKELEVSAGFAEQQTIVSDAKPQRDVVQLGILAYELLGGKRGGFAPLANLSEEGNEILRKCLTPDRSFSSARDFCEALGTIATAKSGSIAADSRTARARSIDFAAPESLARSAWPKHTADSERSPFQSSASLEEQCVALRRGADRHFTGRRLSFGFLVPHS